MRKADFQARVRKIEIVNRVLKDQYIFTSGTGGIAGILSARIVTRETTDLISVS